MAFLTLKNAPDVISTLDISLIGRLRVRFNMTLHYITLRVVLTSHQVLPRHVSSEIATTP
jgi:hypothetical protein